MSQQPQYQQQQQRPQEQPQKRFAGLMLCSCGYPLEIHRIIKEGHCHQVDLKCSRDFFCPDGGTTSLPLEHQYFNHSRPVIGQTVSIPDAALLCNSPSPETAATKATTPIPTPVYTGASTGAPPEPAPKTKTYHCKNCPSEIDQAQAESSFKFLGLPLCKTCMGKEPSE